MFFHIPFQITVAEEILFIRQCADKSENIIKNIIVGIIIIFFLRNA